MKHALALAFVAILRAQNLTIAGEVGTPLTLTKAGLARMPRTPATFMVYALADIDPNFGANKILVADSVDGKPLFDYRGPRLVVPGDKNG
jgi:hypothetical protein